MSSGSAGSRERRDEIDIWSMLVRLWMCEHNFSLSACGKSEMLTLRYLSGDVDFEIFIHVKVPYLTLPTYTYKMGSTDDVASIYPSIYPTYTPFLDRGILVVFFKVFLCAGQWRFGLIWFR